MNEGMENLKQIEDLEKRIEEMELTNKELKKRVDELDNSLSIALDLNDNYQRENAKLKNKPTEILMESGKQGFGDGGK
jgi:chaperonin cofactor prefoldin